MRVIAIVPILRRPRHYGDCAGRVCPIVGVGVVAGIVVEIRPTIVVPGPTEIHPNMGIMVVTVVVIASMKAVRTGVTATIRTLHSHGGSAVEAAGAKSTAAETTAPSTTGIRDID